MPTVVELKTLGGLYASRPQEVLARRFKTSAEG